MSRVRRSLLDYDADHVEQIHRQFSRILLTAMVKYGVMNSMENT